MLKNMFFGIISDFYPDNKGEFAIQKQKLLGFGSLSIASQASNKGPSERSKSAPSLELKQLIEMKEILQAEIEKLKDEQESIDISKNSTEDKLENFGDKSIYSNETGKEDQFKKKMSELKSRSASRIEGDDSQFNIGQNAEFDFLLDENEPQTGENAWQIHRDTLASPNDDKKYVIEYQSDDSDDEEGEIRDMSVRKSS